MRKLLISRLMFVAIAVTSLTSCSDDDDYYSVELEESFGLIANASPNSGDLYFFADDNKINSNALNYTDVQGYYRFYDGMRTFS